MSERDPRPTGGSAPRTRSTALRLAALAVVTSAGLVGTGVAPAAAQPTGTRAVASSVVRAERTTGTITITALANQPVSTHAVAGLELTLAPVLGIDLSTAEGQARAKALIEGRATTTPELGTPITLHRTDADGRTASGDLPLGLYLLHQVGERDAHGAVIDSPLTYADLYIALPTTDPSSGQDVYDLTVFPKGAVQPGGEHPTPVPEPTPTDTPTSNPTDGTPVKPVGTPTPVTPTDGSTPGVTPGGNPGGGSGGSGGPGVVPQGGPDGAVLPQSVQQQSSGDTFTNAIRRVIPAGDGAEFSVQDAVASIGAGLVLLSLLVAATRRRRRDDHS